MPEFTKRVESYSRSNTVKPEELLSSAILEKPDTGIDYNLDDMRAKILMAVGQTYGQKGAQTVECIKFMAFKTGEGVQFKGRKFKVSESTHKEKFDKLDNARKKVLSKRAAKNSKAICDLIQTAAKSATSPEESKNIWTRIRQILSGINSEIEKNVVDVNK